MHLFTVFGQEKMDNVVWEFLVNSNKGGKVFVYEKQIKYVSFSPHDLRRL